MKNFAGSIAQIVKIKFKLLIVALLILSLVFLYNWNDALQLLIIKLPDLLYQLVSIFFVGRIVVGIKNLLGLLESSKLILGIFCLGRVGNLDVFNARLGVLGRLVGLSTILGNAFIDIFLQLFTSRWAQQK